MKQRHKILGYALATLFGILLIAQPQTDTPEPLMSDSTVTLNGTLQIIHGDAQDGTVMEPQAFIASDEAWVEIDYTPILDTMYMTEIEATGQLLDRDPTSDDEPLLLEDANIGPRLGERRTVTGNTRWINVACRFADMVTVTPKPVDYFADMMVNEAPAMDHYWRAISGDRVNIEGSDSVGWYDLPFMKNYYIQLTAQNTGMGLRKLLQDCAAQALANDRVDFTQYGGINIMLNDTFGCCAWGGSMSLTINGKVHNFRTTWLPPWAYTSLHVIAHEMGHGWGLPHSSGPYGQVYDSAWDVMSGGTRMLDFCRIGHDDYGCHQVGTIGHHLDILGWIDEDRVITVYPTESKTITINALTAEDDGNRDALLVRIPINGSDTVFYTIEVRNFDGYDRNLPGEAVLLHHVNLDRSSPAHVVDADNNGNPNDEGAMWLVGETFKDSVTNVSVFVTSREGSTFTVQISNQTR